MSGHRRVKDIDFDEDELDDYGQDEIEDLSPEDHEQLRAGKLAVRAALGSTPSINDAEIEDSLWHYYYDHDKTISYLKKKYQSQNTPGQQKNSIKGDGEKKIRGNHGSEKPLFSDQNAVRGGPMDTCNRMHDFFFDTPWLSVPYSRRGRITEVSCAIKPRLLGGSSDGSKQTSKLASLSAARRKAHQRTTKPEKDKTHQSPSEAVEPNMSINLLDRLERRRTQDSPDTHESREIYELQNRPSSGFSPSNQDELLVNYEQKEKNMPDNAVKHLRADESTRNYTGFDSDGSVQGPPSTFAQTVVGETNPSRLQRATESDLFTLAYSAHKELANQQSFIALSPDDAVLRAQGKDAASRMANAGTKVRGQTSQKDMGATPVSGTPTVNKDLIDVVEAYSLLTGKRNASFVVIGHVDHGKSTLMGRLLYDLSSVSKRSVEKLKKEAENTGKGSFAFAWVLDSTAEERSRGVTIDVATKHFETEKTSFTVIDAPGHQDFVPNMISGAGQADFALLVVDASTNAFEAGLKGQTKEHALLARSMGISSLIIAVNKMDLVDWSNTRYLEIKQQLSAFFSSAGFQERNIYFIPCSGMTGDNVASRTPELALQLTWYSGPTLVEALDNLEPSRRDIKDALRLTVGDVFRSGPQNALSVSGRLDAGTLQKGLNVLSMPSGATATIAGISVSGQTVEWAVAGQIAIISLEGIDPVNLRIGDVICDPEHNPIRNVKEVVAKVLAFEHLLPMELNVYKGSLSTSARICELTEVLEKGTTKASKRKPRVVKPGQVARIKILLERPLPLEAASRIVLRNDGQTIAAGLVEAP